MKKNILLVIMLLFFANAAMANTLVSPENDPPPYLENAVVLDLNEWREEPVPARWSEATHKANNSGYECYVFEHDGQIMVADYRGRGQLNYCLPDGCFIGVNKGEWGGNFTFKPHNGAAYGLIASCNPVTLFKVNNSLWLAEGLAHLGINEGKIYKLEFKDNLWMAREYLDLGATPLAVLVEDNHAFVFTYKELFKWDFTTGEPKVVSLIDTEFTHGLYPHSMVKNGDDLIMGMRGGIAVFNLNNGKLRWFIKP